MSGGTAPVRYAAFLRGVGPMNCSMPAWKQCFGQRRADETAMPATMSANAIAW